MSEKRATFVDSWWKVFEVHKEKYDFFKDLHALQIILFFNFFIFEPLEDFFCKLLFFNYKIISFALKHSMFDWIKKTQNKLHSRSAPEWKASLNTSRDNAPNDCELNISDDVHCYGFDRLTRKRKETYLIANSYWFYVWYAVMAFESSRTEVCSPRLTAGTEWIICIIKKKKTTLKIIYD